jgi:hypothetical protein
MQLVFKFFRGSDDFKMQKVYLLQLKVLTNEKKGGLKVDHPIGLALSYSH